MSSSPTSSPTHIYTVLYHISSFSNNPLITQDSYKFVIQFSISSLLCLYSFLLVCTDWIFTKYSLSFYFQDSNKSQQPILSVSMKWYGFSCWGVYNVGNRKQLYLCRNGYWQWDGSSIELYSRSSNDDSDNNHDYCAVCMLATMKETRKKCTYTIEELEGRGDHYTDILRTMCRLVSWTWRRLLREMGWYGLFRQDPHSIVAVPRGAIRCNLTS